MSGTDEAELTALAEEAGIAPRWRDVRGQTQQVAPETLRHVLQAMGLPAASAGDIADAREALRRWGQRLPPLLTAPCGADGVAIPGAQVGHRFRLELEDGSHREGRLERGWSGEARLPALDLPGYHRLLLDGGHTTIAAAPARCFSLDDAGATQHQGARPWGLAVQIPSLRRPGDGGLGDFGSVAQFARSAARHGAAALAISPAHALFSADPSKFSPYAPSTRLFRNVLLADPAQALGEGAAGLQTDRSALIDWPQAAEARLAQLRRLFDQAADHPGFVDFRRDAGPALEDHARFEALHANLLAQDPALWHWRQWPQALRTPQSPGVAAFARDNPREVAFHAFCQWLADASAAAAQRAAREAGMPVGLIADLAVGTEDGGSHAWSRQDELLSDLSVGAPPDIFSPLGQDWGLTAFSPQEMRAGGFHAFIELLQANFRHAGGLRIDHAMGLERLWVVPRGAGAADGAYLHYPVADLLRLLALESHRHRAIVIGEDLGTLPEGFHERMQGAGILGMRVLWFEQEQDGRFRPPSAWSRDAVAMTTTHDLPTVVGWWQGRDIDWRDRLSLFPAADTAKAEQARRQQDQVALWQAMLESGATDGDPPGEATAIAATAAAHIGRAASALAILPAEDALALPEQPNLPGTTEGHPNWQRRLPGDAATLLDEPAVAARLRALALARRSA